MKQRGQAILLVILILGVIMSAVVMFGSKRQADTGVLIERLDVSQTAQEALSNAARKIQVIYANESGCDPDVLDSRLSTIANLPTNPTTAYGAGMSYAVAQPGIAAAAGKANLCATATGCRQFGIPIENRVYVVTAGAVVTGTGQASGLDCPRDATIRLSLAAGGNVYFQRFSLTNICTFDSCNATHDSFSGFVAYSVPAEGATFADGCTGANANVPGKWHGSIINPIVASSGTTVQDIRWARRYLETGGGSTGETSYMYFSSAITSGNGSCTEANSDGQCRLRNCIPAFDLNRDRTNNEIDLAILEGFMRGLLPVLSPNAIDPRL